MSTAAEYREQLKALLPPGQAFPRDPGTTLHDLLDGMSIELARVDDRASALPLEVNPNTTLELLPDWERVAGLPDKCSGTLEETLQGRRNALLAKLTSTGGQSADYFIQLAASLGYAVTIEVFRAFRAGRSVAGDLLSNGDWAFAWRIHAPDVTVIPFRAGLSVAGERLRVWGSDTLECKIRQLAPAHTIPIFAYGDATLDLSFVQDTYRSGANSTTFAGLITFTRSSIGTYFDAAGVLKTAAINAPRFDHHPTTKAPLGLMIEGAGTNLLRYSEQFDNAVWTKAGGIIVVANASVAPDGSMSADKIIPSNGASTVGASVVEFVSKVAAPVVYTASVFAKAGEMDIVRLFMHGANTTTARCIANFNLITKSAVVVSQGSSGFDDATVSITDVGGGYFRVSLTATTDSNAGVSLRLYSLSSTLSVGDDVSGVYVWGAHLDAGPLSSYIPTTSAAVTRAADVAAVNTLTPWFSPARGTLYAEATNLGPSGTTIAQLGTISDRILTSVAPAGFTGSGGSTIVGSVNQASMQSAVGAPGQKVAYAYATNDFACAVGGTLIGTDTSGALPTVSSMLLGSNGAAVTNCYIRQITYSPKRLSNDRLQAMTAP
jgi:uncharacterized protein YmfQ (DUF2313 family)